jgi:uncharacterized protein (DUF1684 family)|tara:strand:- start:1356 stop:1877 length:522 start_codon:yes stop_codon:yes gene_type:complete
MTQLTEFRTQKDAYFGEGHDSPLSHGQRERFNGLVYFNETPELAFRLTPSRVEDSTEIDIPLSTGGTTSTNRWATVSLELDGDQETLTVFREHDEGPLFLPFRDGTSGKETYPVGRYLEVHILEDGDLWLDFNYAYNPYCAYNDNWACPIPPSENRLTMPIRAGERLFPDPEH